MNCHYFVKCVATHGGDMTENVLSGTSSTFYARCIMQDIFWGVVIIGIGLAMGGSIFLGEFTLFNFFFDGLGIFFIGKGAMSMVGQSSSE